MILVVDSGASKADWALIESGKLVKTFQSKGISPVFHSEKDISSILSETFSKEDFLNQVERIFFYGAGCIKGNNTDIIESGLKGFFKNAETEIESDLLGAARALFGKEAGIACIMGTGANSSKYDGTSIVERIPTLGFILGDECSGAYLGKMLIHNYYRKIMPSDLAEDFNREYKLSEKEVIDRVYKQTSPNRYLAGFTVFLKKHIERDYSKTLLSNAFQAFISNNLVKYSDFQNYKLGIVGSVAHHFSDIFKQAALKNGLEISKIMEKPIEGLVEFHCGLQDLNLEP